MSNRDSAAVNRDSEFVCGVERHQESPAGISGHGEALSFNSGTAGDRDLAWAYYRIPLGGVQPGVVSIDANPVPRSDGTPSTYYAAISDYSTGTWEWHGPFMDNHVRLGTGTAVGQGRNYLSSLGNLFVCIVAWDGSRHDVIGIGVNTVATDDTLAPAAPAGAYAVPVVNGLDLHWDNVPVADLAGYQVYYSAQSFTSTNTQAVKDLGYLAGSTRQILAGLTAKTHVRISAVDINGNESELSSEITATPLPGAAPQVALTASAPDGLLNDVITLTAVGATEYSWDLDGDGIIDISGDTTGTQAADTSGTGIIRPTVRGTTGDGSSVAEGAVSLIIASNSRPVANAYATPTRGAAPLLVTLTGSGVDDDGTLAEYSWDFNGDGAFDQTDASDPGPVAHTFTDPGVYNAKFRVVDDLGSWDVDTVTIVVDAAVVANQAPIAVIGIGAGEETGELPHTVQFDASGSSDPDHPGGGGIIKYHWDFDGDGGFETVTFGPTISKTYTLPGIFTAKCTVEDEHGDTGSDTVEITVTVPGNASPVAALGASHTYCDTCDLVTFDASASSDSDGSIVNYEWDFDNDGVYDSYGLADTTTHAYANHGLFTARCRVTDDDGDQATATVELRVNETFGAWWNTDGGNPRRTGRSPYVGAQLDTVAWFYDSGTDIVSSPVLGSDGTVYVGSNNNYLTALDPDGVLKWSYNTSGDIIAAPTIGPDGTSYFGSNSDVFYAIYADGGLKWSFDTGADVKTCPVIGPDGMVYFTGSSHYLYAYYPSGTERWTYDAGDVILSSPALGSDGMIYFCCYDHNLHAVTPDGIQEWTYTAGTSIPASPAIGTDGRIFFGAWDGYFHAVNPDGTRAWRYSISAVVHTRPAIDSDGSVYFTDGAGTLHKLSPDGSLIWDVQTGVASRSAPAIGADGTVYFGCDDGSFFAVNSDSTPNWATILPDAVESSPAIGPDGAVYVGCSNGYLYAFGE